MSLKAYSRYSEVWSDSDRCFLEVLYSVLCLPLNWCQVLQVPLDMLVPCSIYHKVGPSMVFYRCGLKSWHSSGRDGGDDLSLEWMEACSDRLL